MVTALHTHKQMGSIGIFQFILEPRVIKVKNGSLTTVCLKINWKGVCMCKTTRALLHTWIFCENTCILSAILALCDLLWIAKNWMRYGSSNFLCVHKKLLSAIQHGYLLPCMQRHTHSLMAPHTHFTCTSGCCWHNDYTHTHVNRLLVTHTRARANSPLCSARVFRARCFMRWFLRQARWHCRPFYHVNAYIYLNF